MVVKNQLFTYSGNRIFTCPNDGQLVLYEGFGCFMKEFAKKLMVLESNIKAIRPITAALTC